MPSRLAGVDGCGLPELVAATRKVAREEGESREQSAREAAAWRVVPGKQQVHGHHHGGVEQEAHQDFEQN
ncbi:hypothetical protein GCM10025876_29200 [Demequina litorisediminis]|uniref:Uncharacterized protein n=1 Tax=Demequina litorisediminis TaxID=1849022 RepID=A0ABQ6IG66_9MICO|nr:hypothetical protein GCM10025876_29200 [Demequina litorisediminis]